MPHRVHPKSFRIQISADWHSRGFYGKNLSPYLKEDFRIRSFLNKTLKEADLSSIDIERSLGKVRVIISTARPGLLIGRRGERVDFLRKELAKLISPSQELKIDIEPIKNPWVSASLMAQWMARQIEKRVYFRRVLKQALGRIVANKEIEGARVQLAGRLGGGNMSRREWLAQGKLPRQTLRAKIDYAEAQAFCFYGVIGVKVWIYKGESFA